MKRFSTLSTRTLALALGLLFASTSVASAVVTLRTAPFPGSELFAGFARCSGRNGGTTSAKVTMTLFDLDGDVLASDTVQLSPDDADTGGSVSLASTSPFFCECKVPSSTNFSCSFTYTNGAIHVVVPGQ